MKRGFDVLRDKAINRSIAWQLAPEHRENDVPALT
jgi:hypothetical protein